MWTLSGFADEIDPDPDVQFRTLNELGIRNVELRSVWGINVLDLDDDQIESVRAKLRRYGISVSAIGSPIGKIDVTGDFEQHLARFDRTLQVADRLESRLIRLFSFFMPDGSDPSDHRDDVLRRMAALVARSAGHDVLLCHENERKIYGDIPARCLDLVESIGSDRFRLVWDPANFVQCGVRPYSEGFAQLRPHLEYLQIKDAIAGTGEVVPAGKGAGEIVETLHALREHGWGMSAAPAYVSMEPHLASAGAAGGFSGVELFRTATDAFTALLAEAGIAYA